MAVVGLLVGWSLAASGCGEQTSESSPIVKTRHPEKIYAPVVLLAEDEPARPASARWFIERSVFYFADDEGCADREVAVGRSMPERHTVDIGWIYHRVLGGETWAYYRSPFDRNCDSRLEFRGYADQRTRPHDRVDRPAGIRQSEGFYLDLVDDARGGPPTLDRATSYFERVNGDRSAVRLSYWLLFTMNAPPGRPDATHEGDWERVDVLLRRRADGRYVPRAVRVGAIDEQGASDEGRLVPWRAVQTEDATHPVLVAERGSHVVRPLTSAESCDDCERWPTWEQTEPVREQLWHGFGGAWGEVGPTGATTGPLGPHGKWASHREDGEVGLQR